MDPDELEEKDERQHSDLHWHWRADIETHTRISEMKSEESDESISPGRYNLAFILNSQRAPSSSPPPATTDIIVEFRASARRAHTVAAVSAASASLFQPPRRTNKRLRSHTSNPFPASSEATRAASPPQTPAASSNAQPFQMLLSSDKPSTDDRLGKKRGRTCKTDGCDNYIVHKGLCCRHGGGRKCSVEGCETSAKHKGLCWKHGGSIECKIPNCTKKAKAKGLCWAHGGGTKCTEPDCSKVAISHGCCWAHGGGKRCIYDGCNRPAYGRTNDFCTKHFAELQDADYYEV